MPTAIFLKSYKYLYWTFAFIAFVYVVCIPLISRRHVSILYSLFHRADDTALQTLLRKVFLQTTDDVKQNTRTWKLCDQLLLVADIAFIITEYLAHITRLESFGVQPQSKEDGGMPIHRWLIASGESQLWFSLWNYIYSYLESGNILMNVLWKIVSSNQEPRRSLSRFSKFHCLWLLRLVA